MENIKNDFHGGRKLSLGKLDDQSQKSEKDKLMKVRHILETFIEKIYPKLFNFNNKLERKPLERRIYALIVQDLKEKKLDKVLELWKKDKNGFFTIRHYTNDIRYHFSIMNGDFRYGLNGEKGSRILLKHKINSYLKLVDYLDKMNKKKDLDEKTTHFVNMITKNCLIFQNYVENLNENKLKIVKKMKTPSELHEFIEYMEGVENFESKLIDPNARQPRNTKKKTNCKKIRR